MQFKEWLAAEGRWWGAVKGLAGGAVDAAAQVAGVPSPRDIGVTGIGQTLAVPAQVAGSAVAGRVHNLRSTVAPTDGELARLRQQCLQHNHGPSCDSACQFDRNACRKVKELIQQGLYQRPQSRHGRGYRRMQQAWQRVGGR